MSSAISSPPGAQTAIRWKCPPSSAPARRAASAHGCVSAFTMFTGGGGGFGAINPGQGAMMLELTKKPPAAADRATGRVSS